MLPNQQNGMDPQDQRNFIIAMALMIVFVFGYQFFVLDPAAKRAEEQRAAAADAAGVTDALDATTPGTDIVVDAAPTAPATIEAALSGEQRITFDANRVDGSILLKTSEIDDLNLKDHYKTVERAEELRLLRPRTTLEGKTSGYSATWNWSVLNDADPQNPTIDPVPYVGVQFVAIPEFAGIATEVSQEFSAVYAGQQSVDEALAKAQALTNDAMEAAGYR